ncbi:MAG TPA: pilus assembly protein N-terminal domain-containing protein [Devosiaceae bacterium]
MSAKLRMLIAALALGAIAQAPTLAPAAAKDTAPVSVTVNMARILRINSPASTVIVGNPGIADVTIQDPQTLVLTGKSYGKTNLIVLDSGGNPIADTLIEVVASEKDAMTVYMGAARSTLACSPTCQPVIMLGDDPNFTSVAASSAQMVQSSAK